MADDVQLTDLEVIQRYSLAVRGATASRAELIEALQADLDWLGGGVAKPAPATRSVPRTAPSRAATKAAAARRASPRAARGTSSEA